VMKPRIPLNFYNSFETTCENFTPLKLPPITPQPSSIHKIQSSFSPN
jgi:hypothetical protein